VAFIVCWIRIRKHVKAVRLINGNIIKTVITMRKIAFMAIAAACVLASCNNQAPKMDEKSQSSDSTSSEMKIAYVEVDSIMSQYQFCKEY
jgi:hypothetical protein